MKKFVGTVNGKSFDNEKDFNEAAQKAIASGEENLSISSYYKYVSDEVEKSEPLKESEQVKELDYALKHEDFMVDENHPQILIDGNYEYPISNKLKEKLEKATNKEDIKLTSKFMSDVHSFYSDRYYDQSKELDNKVKELQQKIEELENELDDTEDKLYQAEVNRKKSSAAIEYYTRISSLVGDPDGINTPTREQDEPKIKKDENLPVDISLYDILDEFGFW